MKCNVTDIKKISESLINNIQISPNQDFFKKFIAEEASYAFHRYICLCVPPH